MTTPQAKTATLAEVGQLLDTVQAQPRRLRGYPQYQQTGHRWLDSIPSHWRLRRLKFVSSLKFSNVNKTTEEGEETVRLCNYVDVYKRDYITSDINFMVASATKEEVKRFSLARGDVLVTKDSEEWNDIAVPTLVDEELSGVLCGYHLAQIRPNPKELAGEYLARAFAAHPICDQFRVAANGITRFGLSVDSIASGWFPVPPLEEQQAIGKFLRRETARIDSLVEKKRRLIDLLREKRTALISRAVTKGLNPTAPMKPSGIDWLGDVPANWESKRLRFVGEALLGLTYEPIDVTEPGAGTLVLRSSNIAEGRIVLDDNVYVTTAIPPEIRTRVGDILICSRNGSRALIGKCARIDESAAGVTFGAFMTVFRSPASAYVFYVLNSAIFDYQSGAFLTATINQLTLSSLKNMEVPIPPPDEQAQIVAFLDKQTTLMDRLKERIHGAINRLLEYRSALISAAVTGKIDVRKEVADGSGL